MSQSAIAYLSSSLHEAIRGHVSFTGEFLSRWVIDAVKEFLAVEHAIDSSYAFPTFDRAAAKMVKLTAEEALIDQMDKTARRLGIPRNVLIAEAATRKLKKERSTSPESNWGHQVAGIRRSRQKKSEIRIHLTEELYESIKFLSDKKKTKRATWISEALAEFYRELEFEQLVKNPIKFPGKRWTTNLQIENDFINIIEKQVKRVKKVRPAFSLSAFARLAIQHKLAKEGVSMSSPTADNNAEKTPSPRSRRSLKQLVQMLLPFQS